MIGEWWHTNEGDNLLAGVVGDTDNPIRLPNDYIVAFLSRIPEARASFNRLVPQMLPAEQTRLNALALFTGYFDPRIELDTFQHCLNTQRILTCGPRGGKRG